MTAQEIIARIKAEVEWLKKTDGVCQNNNETADVYYSRGAKFVCDVILSFLSTLESEKPIEVGEDFEKEYAKFSNDPDAGDYAFPIDLSDYRDFARHFYDLGCRRTAEKYDEIEWNRQRAEEEVCKEFDEECERYFNSMTPEQFLNTPNTVIARHFAKWGAEHLADASKMISEDLEEAAIEYSTCGYSPFDDPYEKHKEFELSKNGFKAGTQWQKEQMMKEAVEGKVGNIIIHENGDEVHYSITYPKGKNQYSINDKVKIIIL